MSRLAPSPSRVAVLAAAMLASAAVPLAAAPLDLTAVPADAKWLMHFDMDAARDSIVVQRAWERMLKMHPHAGGMMDMAAKMTGMDPRKDLRDVTAWGFDTDKRNGVMVVRGKVNRELLEKMVEKAADHKTMKHGDYTLHAWTHKGWRGRRGAQVVGAFHRDDVMVFGRAPDKVKAALDVLDGTAGGVNGEGPLAGRVRPGSILVARAAAVDPETKCPVLKQGRAFRVAMGENAGQSFYRARLEMESRAAADAVEDVVKGFTALGRLRWGDDADALQLVNAVQVDVAGETCTIAWDAAADRVATVVDRAMDDWQKRHGGRGGRWGGCPDCDEDGCEGCGKGECPMQKGREGSRAEKPWRDDEF
jgi:hypothetical protein